MRTMSAFLQTQRPGAPKPSPSKRGARKRRPSAGGSINGDDVQVGNPATNNNDEGSGGEDNDAQGGKKKVGVKGGAVVDIPVGGPVEYKYHAEIAQMVSRSEVLVQIEQGEAREAHYTVIIPQVYVFGEIQSPAMETVNLIEDMVRSQMIELVSP